MNTSISQLSIPFSLPPMQSESALECKKHECYLWNVSRVLLLVDVSKCRCSQRTSKPEHWPALRQGFQNCHLDLHTGLSWNLSHALPSAPSAVAKCTAGILRKPNILPSLACFLLLGKMKAMKMKNFYPRGKLPLIPTQTG